jgi:hypothetical protein
MSHVIDHVVLLKLKDPANTSELTNAVQSLACLTGVKSITAGPTYVPDGSDDRRAGYNYSLTVRFLTREALVAYGSDERHVKVKSDFIAPALDKSQPSPVLAVDFESEIAVDRTPPRNVPNAMNPNSNSSLWKLSAAGLFAVAAFLWMRPRK